MSASLQSYIDGYQALPAAPAWLKPVQDAALERASHRGLPGGRDEAWKYTSVAALEKRSFRPTMVAPKLTEAELAPLLIPDLSAYRAVFVDGVFQGSLSRLPSDVRALPLHRADESLRELLKLAPEWQDDTFVNLNTALFRDGLLLDVAADRALDQPLELLHVSTAQPGAAAHSLRFVVRLAGGASAHLIERHVGLEGAKSFNNVVTQIELGEGAKLSHVHQQSEGTQAFHVGRILVRQAAKSEYRSYNLNTGGLWTRLDLHTRLEAEGARAELHGLYAVTGRQHVDNHTRVDHLAKHTVSRELYRGVLDGQGRAVFNGKVLVAAHAVKTDAEQANHNLILSRGAEIDTKPELEIYADDVKCSHGATIGQLDDEQLFYLRSRGLSLEAARGLLISAFAEEILLSLPYPALADHVRRLLGKTITQMQSEERA